MPKKRPDFFESSEGIAVRQILVSMHNNNSYNTTSSYSANTALYPDHKMPFVDKHMYYLRDHPATDAAHYLANLRLITKVS